MADLNRLYRTEAALFELTDPKASRIDFHDADNSVLTYLRRDKSAHTHRRRLHHAGAPPELPPGRAPGGVWPKSTYAKITAQYATWAASPPAFMASSTTRCPQRSPARHRGLQEGVDHELASGPVRSRVGPPTQAPLQAWPPGAAIIGRFEDSDIFGQLLQSTRAPGKPDEIKY
jgi:hypothetical protein